MLVGKRRALLTYLKDRDITRYRAIVKELGLRNVIYLRQKPLKKEVFQKETSFFVYNPIYT